MRGTCSSAGGRGFSSESGGENSERQIPVVPELIVWHTGENLRDVIIKVLEDYDINIKEVYTSTTDNGSNMMKVSDLLKKMQEAQEIDEAALEVDMQMPEVLDLDFVLLNKDEMVAVEKQSLTAVPCTAHVLQLKVEDFQVKAELKALIDKSRKLGSRILRQNFHRILSIIGGADPPQDPDNPCQNTILVFSQTFLVNYIYVNYF
ncbi:unnamed protein product [Bemisia tabaci]|uniref:Uncharacterized protein n=1 Tax=Bemisia tabaci TaxID=7038 RepID=A0A9P0F2H7_BEMTA|nr:unnamed protein product [Bemisia tabaci]